MSTVPSGTVVLNVNDDEATRYLYSNILKRAGFTVREAANGEEALLAVQKHRPDLVLLDVKLPDLSGLEVCRRIKANPLTATVLVVQTSATYSSTDRRVEGLDSGADTYLASPVDAVELVATVRAMLRTRDAEDEERKTARKLAKTFDAITDPLLILDRNGTVRQCNEAATKLFEEANVLPVGRNASDALKRFLAPDELRSLLTSASRGGRREREVEFRDRWYRASADPIHSEQGDDEGIVLLLSDITDRKALEEEHRTRAEELAAEARRKDEFLAMLAHELRNPLNAIGAANTLLDRGGPHDANSVRLRGIISRQTRHLARMIDDLLEVSRITRGKIQLRKGSVDFVEIVKQAIHGSQPSIDARKQHVVLALPDQPMIMEGDDLRLEQIVLNVISNAVKYSEPQTTIRVNLERTTRADGTSGARLTVTDQGIGIPPDMLEKIFDPFVQVDQSLARSLGGLGIGLTMVKSLVGLHGGTVRARSEGSGHGAEVTVDLPLAGEAAARPSARAPASNESPRTLSVLVVEDNQDTLELLQQWLQLLGHSVQGAPDGRAGLQLAISMRPDLAFVDIGLPELDGIEVAKHIRANEAGRSIHLVAVTGYGRPEDRARALDAGFDDYIVKPLDPSALDRVLSRVASGAVGGAKAADGASTKAVPPPPASPRSAEQTSSGGSSRSRTPQ